MKCKNCKMQGEIAMLFEGTQSNIYKAIKEGRQQGSLLSHF